MEEIQFKEFFDILNLLEINHVAVGRDVQIWNIHISGVFTIKSLFYHLTLAKRCLALDFS